MGLTETTSEQADVYVYLHKKLDENFAVIASLEEKLESLEDENERLQKLARKEIAAAAAENEAKISDMQRENERLQSDLMALEAFRSQREATQVCVSVCLCVSWVSLLCVLTRACLCLSLSLFLFTRVCPSASASAAALPVYSRLQAELERLRKALEDEKTARQLEVAELERRNVAAKDRLKKEMFAKIKETKRVRLCALASRRTVTSHRPPVGFRSTRAFLQPQLTSCTTQRSGRWRRTSRSRLS